MGIAQIALDPPPVKWANVGKKCPKPSWQDFAPHPPLPYRQCLYGNNTFQKGASLYDPFNVLAP